MVGRRLGVADGGHALTPHRDALIPNGEHDNGGVTENWQVALTELHEGLVASPLQSVVEVVTLSRGKPSRHGRVGGVSWNVHMDLAVPQPKLTVRTATVRKKPRVAEAVQHVPKQGRKPGAVQPITTEPSVGSKGDVGVIIHLSKTREKRINISSIEQRKQIKTPKINHDDSKTLTQILFSAMTISQNSADLDWYRIRKNTQYGSNREF
jgi:hypothetical protein